MQGKVAKFDPLQWAVIAIAALIAILSAWPYAGGWNDGSRLATVECLVDHRTLAIDESIFVAVPPPIAPGASPPYPADDPILTQLGTCDKLFIDGHYYSDKPPVPALWLAGVYQVVQWLTGLTAREQPGWFIYLMTLASSGLAYVVAAWCVYRMARAAEWRAAGISPAGAMLIATVFALGTLALPYTRHVNNHMMLLGVSAAAWLLVAGPHRDVCGSWRVAALGLLAGLAYAIDFGAGPLLLATLLALVIWRRRRAGPVLLFLLASLPPIALHHAVNYAIGGTWLPANTVPDYFRWPHSPFSEENLTGFWHHDSMGRFVAYSLGMLLAKRGFLGHSLPVLLALGGLGAAWKLMPRMRAELLAALGWCVGVWLLYAASSNNSAGLCCSIRWFVPLLAPLFFVLIQVLSARPDWFKDFQLLAFFSVLLMAVAWWQGPWTPVKGWLYYPCLAAALMSWGWLRLKQRRAERAHQFAKAA